MVSDCTWFSDGIGSLTVGIAFYRLILDYCGLELAPGRAGS